MRGHLLITGTHHHSNAAMKLETGQRDGLYEAEAVSYYCLMEGSGRREEL